MSYASIVRELASQLDACIIAFDNLPQTGGCILYLDGPLRRIDIQIDALDRGASEVVAFVRQLLAEPQTSTGRVGIGMRDGSLALMAGTDEPES